MKSLIKIGVVSLACLVGFGVQAQSSQAWQDRLSVEQMPLYQAQAPVSNLTISGAFNQAVYQTGDTATLTVALAQPANQEAHVALVQAYPDGRVVQLFPNRYQPNNVVRGNNRFEIRGASPQGLFVNDAPGTYLVKLIASTDKKKLATLLSEGKTASHFSRLATSAEYTQGSGTVLSMSEIGYQVAGQAAVSTAAVVPPSVVTPAVVPSSTAASILSMVEGRGSDFHVSIMPKGNKTTYVEGDELVFQLTSENTCEAGLIHLQPDGQVRVLYPNKVEKKVKLKAGKVSWLGTSEKGLRLRATTAGVNHYILACSDKPNLWQMIFGREEARTSFDIDPMTTVQALLADEEKSLEAYAVTSITVANK